MTDELNYKYVLGIDPGGTTGIAMLRYTDETAPELIYLHQQKDGVEGFYKFFHGTQPVEEVTIVSESFTIREGVHGADVTPLKIEGMQYVYWGDEVVYQEPSMKSLVPDAWLKEQNLWTPGHRHQMDGLIHAFVYLRNEMHEPTLKALSGDAEQTIAEPGEAENAQLQMERITEAVEQAAKSVEELAKEVEKTMAAMEQLYGGEGSEHEEQLSPAEAAMAQGRPQPGDGDGEPSEGEGEGSGEGQAEGESDGEPTGSGGNGGESEVHEPVVLSGTRRKRTLNGAFTGFDED